MKINSDLTLKVTLRSHTTTSLARLRYFPLVFSVSIIDNKRHFGVYR